MPAENEPMPGDRRDFLKTGLRACALGALAFTGTALGLRTAAREAGAHGCSLDLPCRRCRQLTGCSEPRAAHARDEAGPSVGRGGEPESEGVRRD